jgi:signal transduction histidine kinase
MSVVSTESKPVPKGTLQHRIESVVAKAAQWLPQNNATKGVRSPHLWTITALMALGTFLYYVDQTPLVNIPPFDHGFFTSIHDLHRTLFFIPIIYAALVFRVRGGLIASFVFLSIVLPRALLFSPYPYPLLRPLLFVTFAAFVSLLLATQLNRVERERRAHTELNAAYQELSEYDRRLRESQEQLIHTEKLTSLGQLAASIAHEVNNPLAGILVYTQLLTKKIAGDNMPKEVALDYLAKMESELTRSTRLIRNLLDFARQSSPTLKEVDLNDVISRALDLAAHSAALQHIQVSKEFGPSLPRLMADFDQLQQVCVNLIMNAIQAMPEGGTLTLRTSADDSQLKIEVQDTGAGISPENMRKLFTPFFTTKKEVKGVGLGLAVSYGIIQRHHGRIEVQSKEGEGTTFTVYLPVHREEEGERNESKAP